VPEVEQDQRDGRGGGAGQRQPASRGTPSAASTPEPSATKPSVADASVMLVAR
jgi:hypothetical protein